MAPTIIPSLLSRQVVTTTPVATRNCSNISGGDIAGIVIGTILGTLLIAYLISRVRSESYTPRPEPPRRRRRRSMDSRAYVSDDARSYRVSSVRGTSIREPTRVVYAKSERL